jgi:hypothetical protein
MMPHWINDIFNSIKNTVTDNILMYSIDTFYYFQTIYIYYTDKLRTTFLNVTENLPLIIVCIYKGYNFCNKCMINIRITRQRLELDKKWKKLNRK